MSRRAPPVSESDDDHRTQSGWSMSPMRRHASACGMNLPDRGLDYSQRRFADDAMGGSLARVPDFRCMRLFRQ
jgi:hypothetical protein